MAVPQGNEFHQGDHVEFDVIVYQDETFTEVMDVSGGSVEGTIGLKKTGEPALDADLPIAGTVVNGPSGHIRVALLPAQTELIPPRDWDVQIFVTIDDKPGCVSDEKFRVHRKIEASAA